MSQPKSQKTKRKSTAKYTHLQKQIFGMLSKVWRWWPPRAAVIKRTTRKLDGTEQTQCEKCKAWFDVLTTTTKRGKKRKKRQTEVDHIEPKVDPEKGFQGFDILIARTFVPEEKLQSLCKKGCHLAKTNKENTKRRKSK